MARQEAHAPMVEEPGSGIVVVGQPPPEVSRLLHAMANALSVIAADVEYVRGALPNARDDVDEALRDANEASERMRELLIQVRRHWPPPR